MDTIVVSDLEVAYHVGVPAEERSKPQRLLLTIGLELSFERAAAGEDLRATVDYYALTRRLLRFGEQREWKLIETLAVDIARMILDDFRPDAVTVEVKKFILPEARHVSVQVRRSR